MFRTAFITLALFVCSGSVRAAPLPRVSYTPEVSTGSWQPVTPSDLSRAIEHAALEELTRPGLLQLERAEKGKDANADFALNLRGHLLDEAETLTVSLTFAPAKRGDLGSFNAARTVVLSKLNRAQIVDKVEQAAREAAKELLAVLGPRLARAGNSSTLPAPEDPLEKNKTWPWQWAEVHVPQASVGAASQDLYAKDSRVRNAALRELTSLALSEASPRHVLERCALEHKDDDTRRGCLEALRPLSRRIEPTQRVVIEVYRKERESRTRQEANEQMLYFTGASRQAAIQAWLESAANGTPDGPLGELGDLPNLDLAIKKCLFQNNKKKSYEGSRSGCIALLEPLGHERRKAVLWPFMKATDPSSAYYLPGAGAGEGSSGTAWGNAVDKLLEYAPAWDPAFEDILWARYQRDLSHTALHALCDYAVPSKRLAERMLEVVQTAGEHCALRAVEKMAKASPEVADLGRNKLAEMMAMGTYGKNISAEELARTLKTLEGGK